MTTRYFIYTFRPNEFFKQTEEKKLYESDLRQTTFDTKQEAIEYIEEHGQEFVHYTIIEEFYKTSY